MSDENREGLTANIRNLNMTVGFPKDTLRWSSKPASSGGPKSSEMILILNPNSQGGTTGKNWDETYRKQDNFSQNIIKLFLPRKQAMVPV